MLWGDVTAIIAAVVGVSLATWAAMTLSAHFMLRQTRSVSLDLATRPWSTLFLGFALGTPMVIVSLALVSAAQPILKLAGLVWLMLVLLIAVIGAGGVARFVGQRIQNSGGAESEYQGISKAATLIVLTGLMPVFGWFLVLPCTLALSIGGGIRAILRRPTDSAQAAYEEAR